MTFEENLIFYDNLIEIFKKVERKGKTTPYTSINGHMFSFLSKDGEMGLRLSKSDKENFIQEYQVEQMMQHGRLMNEYVKIPNELLPKTKELLTHLNKSFTYVSNLKPKPTKKKK